MKTIDLVSQFIEETRGHPLDVTVPEAQLLHDFATWVDNQSAQQIVQAELCPICFDDGIGSEKWGGHHPGCPNAKRAQSA